jgi:Tfp pilus assembly protein PilW
MALNGIHGPQSTSLRQTEAGTSLLELMGAMAAGLVVLGAALQSLSYFQQEFSRQQDRIAQQQDLRLGLELLEQELRLAGSGSLSAIMLDEIQFSANIHGLMTNVTAAAEIGQTTIAVDDGLGWPDRKLVQVCWNDQCEPFTLARTGQRNLLSLMEPIPRMIPAGASVAAVNRVRYYSRSDEKGSLRLLRQVDGGASVLVGNIEKVMFSYWNEQGQVTAQPALVRRIVVEISLTGRTLNAIREISLRT